MKLLADVMEKVVIENGTSKSVFVQQTCAECGFKTDKYFSDMIVGAQIDRMVYDSHHPRENTTKAIT